MKRISKPTEEMPEVYKSMEKDEVSLSDVVIDRHEEKKDTSKIPSAKVHNYNLNKIKSFKQIRKRYKTGNYYNIFIHDLKIVLDEYQPIEDYQYNNELLVHVLNICEAYFIYGKKEEREKMKTQAIKELMKKFYHDDEELLDVMISTVWNKVKKSTIFKRVFARVKNYFFLK